MKAFRFHFDAETEVEDAVVVYENQREGRGVKFRQAVERAIREIQRGPKACPKYKRTRCREYIVRRFPYAIYYEEQDDSILIVR